MTRWFVLFAVVSLSQAAVQRVDSIQRTDVLNGSEFGPAGQYERITGILHFAVDPKLGPNKIITDIDLAPKNSQGQVEYSANFYVLRPRDAAKGNGTALVEISNRGGKGLLSTFDFASGSLDPRSPTELGDNFLLKQGFTLVWIGWEWDVPAEPPVLSLVAPIVTDHGKTITGLVRSEWTGTQTVTTIPLGDRGMRIYPVANPNDPANELLVRDTVAGERHKIARKDWAFSDDSHVSMQSGFAPGKIYEVVYKAKDPVVAGLGEAAVRDMVSYLKYGGVESPLAGAQGSVKRALGFGISQSGRFLRTFLYEGFNEDESHRQVFDGVWAHVAGAGRGPFNARFSQPSRDGQPFVNVAYAVDLPPFTDEALLAKAANAKVAPKLFLTNGSYEYWGRVASLIHTSPDGKQDLPPGADTRIYFFAGSQHTTGSIPPARVDAQNLTETNDYRYGMRALLLSMQSWLTEGKQPPASVYPKINKDELVSLTAFAFPHIQSIHLPAHKREAYQLDFTSEPPKYGKLYVSLVPQVDVDGNETSGIKMPEVAVPLASYTGWNPRLKAIGAPDEMFSYVGSWIPFAVNEKERQLNQDPRQSIEVRYKQKRDYLEKITGAAQKLVRDGFILDQDVEKLRNRAAQEWDYVLTSN